MCAKALTSFAKLSIPHVSSGAVNLRALDVLRGLLVSYVLLGHARWLLWCGQGAWNREEHHMAAQMIAVASGGLRFGHEAVMVFFVLSGFFIHLRAAKKLSIGPTAPGAAGDFYRRRFHRLAMPYVAALLVTFACDMAGRTWFPQLYRGETGDALLDLNFQRKVYALDSVLPALVMLPTSLGKDFGSNGPLWSLSYEVIYYALYPVWLLLRNYGSFTGYIGVSVAAFAVDRLVGGYFGSVMRLYPVWLAGAWLAECLTSGERLKLEAKTLLAILFITIGLQPARPVLAYSLGGAAIVILFARVGVEATKARFFRLVEFIGIMSYSIYIVHFPVLTLVSSAAFAAHGQRPSSGWLALAGAVAGLGAGLILFRFCERYFLHPRIKFEHRSVVASG